MVARVRSWYRQHPRVTLGVTLGLVGVTLLAIWLVPALAAQETLHPSGAGTTYNQWTVTSSWATDLDASGDSLIGSENTDAQAQALHMDDPTFDTSATINSVTVYAMARTTGNDDLGLGIYDGTNTPVYTTHNVSGTFAQWSSGPYATNPWTSSPWTYADIQGLQVYMVEVKAGGQDSVEVDEVWIVVDYTLVSPTLTVTQGSDTGRPTAKIYRGQSADVAVDELNLAASNGDVTVTQIVVRGLDTVDTLTTDVTSVRLFEDDGDGVYNGGDVQVGSSQTFSGATSGSTATFSGLTYTITSGTSENVWIVYTIGASAVDEHIVGSQVQNGDITVQAGQQVTAFATITSANAGQTIQVDAAAPTANTTDPLNDDVLTGASKTIAGTSSDGAGSGVASVEIRIARDDGQYWDGGGWTGTETWVGATGTTNWTYNWSLDAGQNRQRTYTITARATDNVGLTGTDATPVTGVKVDNTGPTISSATAVDATTVDVLFNEALDGATIAASDFTIAGLTVSGAVLQGDNVTVRLTTSAQTPGSPYTVQCAAGNVADIYANTNPATNANFNGYTPAPELTVSQGADAGRPTVKVYRGQGAVQVVDEISLAASNGDTTVTAIVVRGLDTGNALTTNVTAVRLFEDDGDGVYDGEDVQVGSSQTFSGDASGSTVTFGSLTYVIAQDDTKNLWVVYTVGAAANDGDIVGSELQDGDVTVAVGANVTFSVSPITSANAGQTIQVDAAAPTANTTDPLNDDVLTGASKTIAGTSSDGSGSGVTSVEVRIRRGDGQYWNGGGWTGTETWVGATGTTNWTYNWSLDAGQNRETTYTITARATDNVGLTGTDATPVTGVRVDNTGPTISSASAVDTNTVDVLFNEALDGATIAASDFTIAGLTVSGAVLQGDNVTVRLTTSAQTPGSPYTVQCAAGNVADIYANTNPATSAGFTGFGSPPVGGTLTVSQGADAGRPSTLIYRTRDDVTVVDELVLSAAGGDVTIGQLVVRGLDTGNALTTNVTAVRLFEDDGDGLFVDGPDSQVGTTKTFSGDASGSTATFDSLAYTVSNGVTKKLWIVYTIGAAANDGHVLGSRVNDGDITPTVGTVGAFADIISANVGQTVQIDASAPTVNTSDPLNDAVLTGSVKQIAGTSSDGTGSGLAGVSVRILSSDGEYWDTDHWSAVEAWNPATGTTNWTYDWALDSGQNRETTYTITARATDNVGLTGTDATPVTNVSVDNIGPSIQSASAVGTNTVDVTFDEPLDPVTVAGDGSDFTIAGLTISAAAVQPGNQVVRLTTSDQTPGAGYTVQIAAGNVDDPYGNPGLASGVGFSGFGTVDTEPPSVPGNVNVVAGAAPPVIATVSWDASTDNVGVVGYKVWRSMTSTGTPILIGSTTLLTFDDTSGIPGQQYFYRVSAYDAASNESAKSGPAGPVTSTWTQAPHTVYTVATKYCRMCHAPHVATTQSSLMRPTDRAPGELSVCYACHDGQGASTNILAGADNSFALASGHVLEDLEVATDLSNRCSSCHSPHSDYSGKPKLPRETINGDTVSTDDNTWCFACHNDTNDWYGVGYPGTSNPTKNATGYPVLGTFPGESTYTNKTVNAHASIPASATARRVFGDCLYCHESHRGRNEFDSLISTFTPTTADTLADDQANGTYASSCLDCHGGTLQSYFTTTPVDIKQFVTAGTSRAGHRIKTAGGNLPVGAPLPCYDCHNPHGSRRGNASLISDELGQSLETSNTAGVRAFCFTCHTSSDGFVWNSVTSSYEAVGTQEVEGLRRDGSEGGVLKIPVVSGHDSADIQSCYVCHGKSYAPGGNNVHNPSGGVSAGGETCYSCHSAYQSPMEDGLGAKTGATRANFYHHVLGSATNEGDAAFAMGSYPTSTSDVYCLSCHVDHDRFNSSKSANLRGSLGSSPATAPTDYSAITHTGICTDCHGSSLAKQSPGTDQKDDGSTATPKIVPGSGASQFGASAHVYPAITGYDDSTTFAARCSKCHNDEQTKEFQTSTDKVGTHWSAARRILAALGGPVTDPLQEAHCYRCHSRTTDPIGGVVKPAAGRDYYNDVNMTAASERVWAQFQLTSKHPVVAAGGDSVECESCHNAHVVTSGNTKVTDPDNTYNAYTYTDVTNQPTYCLKCHDGALPTYVVDGATYRPYAVTQADTALNNKSTYSARGHWSTAGSISAGERQSCAVCHDNHGSNAPKLLGAYDMVDSRNEIGGTEITANDRTVCSACHTNASTSFPAGEAQREAGTGYLTDGTWPGNAVYNTAWNAVTRTGSAHLTALGGGGSSLPGIYAAGDCKICHDVHGTANTYDELRLTFTDAQFTICFDCHDSDGTSSVDIKQYYPPAAGGTNGGDRAGHQVVTSVVGANLALGEAIPCYDCHNPHGSQSAHMLQVRDIGDGAGEIDVSSDDGVRKFCFACHATSDTAEGWTGSAWADITGATVEGFERDGSDGSVLRLPNVNGHRKADLQSCYQCHGNDATNNVHNPTGGISDGGQDCYGCHSAYQSPMEDGIGAKTGATRANFYHHVLGSATNDGDKAFAAGSYPTSTSDVYCLSCHVDHDKFNATKAANLRDALGSNPGTSAADYSSATDSGICTECHASSLAKQSPGTDQKDDGSTATPKIVPGSGASQFGASAHDYYATSTYGDATTFNANCSKCHNDEQTKDFQTSTYRFGVHWSAARRILSALGGTVTDPLQEQHCYRCHSATGDGLTGNKTVANRDWYDATAMGTASERVYQQFQKTSAHPVVAAGGDSVECESCHNAHVVTTGNTRVTDPDNTYNAYTYTDVTNQPTYCLKCHDGALPSYIVDETTYTPYTVTQADTALNNKSTYAARGHWSTAGSISAGERQSCAVCHENHGSDYPKLLGAYDVATSSNRINGTAITGNNNTVCSACHSSASTSFPAFAREAVTGYPTDGTWPGDAVYNTAWNAVTHTGSGHLGANGGGTSTLPSKFAGSCNVCHNVHGTANTYDELNLALAKQDFTICFDCHDSDGPATRNIKTYYPIAAGGSGGGSGHEIVSSVVGANLALGEALPCYDCHNPHGTSSSSYGLLVVTMTDGSTTIVLGDGADEIKMSPADQATAANVRNFCFCCHTTSDTSKGWNGSALAVVTAGAQVEGFDRTTGSQLRLPARSGHREADNQSCYVCHGDDYSGLSTNNVHNPSGGVSEGGTDCYACHSTYQTYMEDGLGTKTGASRATVYHHVMGSATNEGDRAFGFGSYPTSETDLYCLSCHVDHDRFNASMSSNLRQTINGPSPANTDSDYLTTGTFGVCVNCHDTSLTKQVGTDQKDDGSTATPVIAGGTGAGGFGNSAHQYTTTSSFGDATTFKANCSKCHNDENNPAYKDFQTSTNRFGIHWSATRRILSALGGAVADPLQESHCYRCHSRTTDGLAGTKKSVAGRDWYDAANMTAASERVYAQFQLTSKHPVVAAGGDSVECESCHNAHVVTTSAIVTDPDNTYSTLAYGTVAEQATYCLRCHDAGLPSYTVSGVTYIPYTVTQADTALNNKSTYAARAHWTVNGSIGAGDVRSCAACHDNHGSNAPKLLGAYDMVDSRNEINGAEITANDNTVCTACHTGASTSYPTFTREAVTGYPMDGTWPGNAVYIGANGIHRGDADGQDVIWPSSGYADGDCKNCHDVHGTANTYDELRGTFENGDFSNCFACHDGDPSNINIKQYYPVANGGTAVQTADTNFGHKIQVPTGTLTAGEGLPCYDCHNPHGNANSTDGLLVQTMTDGSTTIMVGDAAGEIDMSTGASRRRFCFACHTTADTTAGWNGSSYAVVTAGALVEGIDRTVYDSVNKRGLKLPPVSGHNQADAQDCYGCHGSDYSGATSNNVHNPGPGGSNGGINCLNCHGASSSERYDRMISDTGYYHHVLDSATPGNAPNTGTYPTSETVLECVSCHTDHNYFNGNKGANLRTRINDTAGTASNQDFVAGGSGANNYDDGICLSCHYAARTKSSSQKTTNASAQTLAMSATNYDASLHDYEINNSALVGYGTSAFRANCTKCHDDEQETLKTYQSGTYKIGTHYSAEARIAKALGAALTTSNTSTEENLCYACHSGAGPNDGYGVAAMTARARGIQTQFAKTYKHNVAGYSGIHKADEYNGAPASRTTGDSSDGWYGTSNANKHVECEDCHNPHEAQASTYNFPDGNQTAGALFRPANTAVAVSGANKGTWGVDVNGSSAGKWTGSGSYGSPGNVTYNKLATVSYEWQLCLKCHSVYAWGGNTPPAIPTGEIRMPAGTTNSSSNRAGNMTDVGRDFNPTQYSYHPLFAQGRNQPDPAIQHYDADATTASTWENSALRRQINGTSTGWGLSNTFVDGWLHTSLVTCSDCHNNNDWASTAPHGPHGSSQKWILRAANTGTKVTLQGGTTAYPNSALTGIELNNFCANCHRADVYGEGSKGGFPSSNDPDLARFSHNGGDGMNASCLDGTEVPQMMSIGCYNCHGARNNDGVQASGMLHGTSMGQGDGDNGAKSGTLGYVQDGTLQGDEMGKHFMNGASWDYHRMGYTGGTVVGCSTLNDDDYYGGCTNHSAIDGKTGYAHWTYN